MENIKSKDIYFFRGNPRKAKQHIFLTLREEIFKRTANSNKPNAINVDFEGNRLVS